MSDYWAKYEESRRQHYEKYPNHHEDEIYTCIDCYEMEIAEEEQQRIIKLLEENFNRFDASNNQVDYMSLTDFIELIKGEQK